MWEAVLVLVLNASNVEVAAGSDCRAALVAAFERTEAELTVSVSSDASARELIVRRVDGQALKRQLGAGSCEEAAQAAAVMVERWLTNLPVPAVGTRNTRTGGGALTPSLRPRGDGGASAEVESVRDATSGRRERAGATREQRDGGAGQVAPFSGSPTGRLEDSASPDSQPTTGPLAARTPDGGGTSPTRGLGARERNSATGSALIGVEAARASGNDAGQLASIDQQPDRARAGGTAAAIANADSARAVDAERRAGRGRDGGTDSPLTNADSAPAGDADPREPARDRSTSRAGDTGTASSAGDPEHPASGSPPTLRQREDGRTRVGSTMQSEVGAPSTVVADARLAPTNSGPGRSGQDPLLAAIGTTPPPLRSSPASQARPTRLEVTSLEALAGGGAVFPSATALIGPAVTLELALVVEQRVRVGLVGAFDFGGGVDVRDERGLVRGRLTTRGGLVLPTVQLCLGSTFRLCGGALVGARIDEGQASGTFVFKGSVQRAGAFVVGPNIQGAWSGPGPLLLALDAALFVTPAPSVFQVEGLTPTLAQPNAQGLVRLSVGLRSH